MTPLPHITPAPTCATAPRRCPPSRLRPPVAAAALLCCLAATGACAQEPAAHEGRPSGTTAAGGVSGRAVQSGEPAAGPGTGSPSTRAASPAATVRLETVRRAVPFTRRAQRDPASAAGTRRVRTKGVPGAAALTYRVTYVGGRLQGRTLVRRVVVRQPVAEVVLVGTRAESCDTHYAGGCVPVARDVDCRGGSGDGPAYVSGPVRVVGADVYRLDDDDGIACESD
ncbi:MAG TPA: G5 domain-containing protein [Pilimelia sp.]|nr:G5 domain-containing protein [Pilimelia sp.]